MIEQEVWNEFQTAFIGSENVLEFLTQVLIWFGVTTVFTALITALWAVIFPIKYQESVTIRAGFYQGMSGTVVDKWLGVVYTVDRGRRKSIVVLRPFLKVRRTKLSSKIREKRLEQN